MTPITEITGKGFETGGADGFAQLVEAILKLLNHRSEEYRGNEGKNLRDS
jgi:hypothetical protein